MNSPSFHISGYHNPRELPETDEHRDEPMILVSLPRGFESLDIAVYGHGLSYDDCHTAALEYLDRYMPGALTDEERTELSGSLSGDDEEPPHDEPFCADPDNLFPRLEDEDYSGESFPHTSDLETQY